MQATAPAAAAATAARPVEVLALPQVFGLVEAADLPARAVALQLPALYEEAALLQRLAYKNTNQHRAAKHHQAVCQVLRVLKLLKQQQLPEQLAALHAAAQRTSLPEAPAAAQPRRAKRHQPGPPSAAAGGQQQRQAVRLPSAQAGCAVLRRLLSSAALLLDVQLAVLAAGQHLSGQLSRGYFMPYCLVAAAAVARIRVLAAAGLLELLQAYNRAVALLPLLPVAAGSSGAQEEDACGQQRDVITSTLAEASSLPQMLQLAWAGPIPSLRRLPFEASGPQSFLGQAAELRQTYCISRPGGGPGGAAEQAAWQGEAAAGAAGAAAAAGVGPDLGVAISRASFHQQQGQQRHGKVSREQQQQRPGVFEDKQPLLAEGQQQQQVPAYRTVPGLGFAAGGFNATMREQQKGPLQPPLPAGHVVGAALGAAGAAAAAGDVDAAAEYQQLYGNGVKQQQPAAAAAASQKQHAAPVAARRPVLQVSAALLAMQGGGGSSSDDDDVLVAPAVAAAPVARAAVNVSAVPSAQLQQQQQPAAPGPTATAPPPAAAAVGTGSGQPALLAGKRKRQKKQQQPRSEEAPPPSRDPILDMLLQGL